MRSKLGEELSPSRGSDIVDDVKVTHAKGEDRRHLLIRRKNVKVELDGPEIDLDGKGRGSGEVCTLPTRLWDFANGGIGRAWQSLPASRLRFRRTGLAGRLGVVKFLVDRIEKFHRIQVIGVLWDTKVDRVEQRS